MDSFAALGDRTRRGIVALLAERELRAGEIAGQFKMTGAAISQHLKVLRQTGLVQVERRGRERVYRLEPAGLADMEQWVSQTRTTWNARLDALERALKQEK